MRRVDFLHARVFALTPIRPGAELSDAEVASTCALHHIAAVDIPTEFWRRLDESRGRGGINVCRPCVERARDGFMVAGTLR